MSKERKIERSDCAIGKSLDILGDSWSLLILRTFIFSGCREYGEFMQMPEGISTNILANRLVNLVGCGLLSKHPHPTNKKKYYYDITEKGFDSIRVLMALADWGTRHLDDTYVPPEIKRMYSKDPKAFYKTWKEQVKTRTQEYLATAAPPK
ncbi:MAG: helix-turn-helix transcriptional regulator [Pseudomonadales bacterium]|nr:helix-turn-helix transcriptional regulator [Pseudomonadales bacterium]